MNHFLHVIIDPTAVLMLFVLLYALSVHAWGYYSNKETPRTGLALWPILWIILAILAFIAWCFIVFVS
jgi:hypothetical protein